MQVLRPGDGRTRWVRRSTRGVTSRPRVPGAGRRPVGGVVAAVCVIAIGLVACSPDDDVDGSDLDQVGATPGTGDGVAGGEPGGTPPGFPGGSGTVLPGPDPTDPTDPTLPGPTSPGPDDATTPPPTGPGQASPPGSGGVEPPDGTAPPDPPGTPSPSPGGPGTEEPVDPGATDPPDPEDPDPPRGPVTIDPDDLEPGELLPGVRLALPGQVESHATISPDGAGYTGQFADGVAGIFVDVRSGGASVAEMVASVQAIADEGRAEIVDGPAALAVAGADEAQRIVLTLTDGPATAVGVFATAGTVSVSLAIDLVSGAPELDVDAILDSLVLDPGRLGGSGQA